MGSYTCFFSALMYRYHKKLLTHRLKLYYQNYINNKGQQFNVEPHQSHVVDLCSVCIRMPRLHNVVVTNSACSHQCYKQHLEKCICWRCRRPVKHALVDQQYCLYTVHSQWLPARSACCTVAPTHRSCQKHRTKT